MFGSGATTLEPTRLSGIEAPGEEPGSRPMDLSHNRRAHCVRTKRENYGSPRRGAPCNRDQERSNCPAACSDGSRQTPQARNSGKQCRGTPGAAKQETFPAGCRTSAIPRGQKTIAIGKCVSAKYTG